MFSFPRSKPSLEARIAEIDVEMGEIPPYQYYKCQAMRDEKNKMLKEIKANQLASPLLDPHAHAIIYTLGYYTPAEIFKTHPKSHRDRKQFKKDK